jgi:hypothetical protein
MAASCCSFVTWRLAPPHASVAMSVSCVWAHALVGDGLVMRGGDLSCEAETCRVRRRLVVRGGDFSCEPKTGSFCGKLVGDATNWLRIGRLASEGLDEDAHTTTQAELQANDRLLLDVVVGKGTTILKLLASESEESTSRSCCLRGDNLAVKGGPNPGPCQ